MPLLSHQYCYKYSQCQKDQYLSHICIHTNWSTGVNLQRLLPKMLPMYQRVKYLTFLLVKNFSLNPLITSQKPNTQLSVGGVAEWLNAPVLKTDVGESLPWVRIPPPPPLLKSPLEILRLKLHHFN